MWEQKKYQLSKSKCLICNSDYTTQGIGKHIRSCIKKKFEGVSHKDVTYYLLHIHPDFTKHYFLYLLCVQNTKLEELDNFLRAIWLECCGHLSAFFHGRFNELPKDYTMSQLSDISKDVVYHYDFGSTTELRIKIIGEYKGPLGLKEKIVILARNAQPVVPCDECGERPAVEICTECQWDDRGWLCEQCVEKHPCDRDLFLPVCNSPRTGVCGYEGEWKELRTDKILSNFLSQLQKAKQ